MELLRKCPCPVLSTRHGPQVPKPKIVAAVNASAEPEEQALNAKIIDTSLLLAKHLGSGPPMLLYAWALFAEKMIRSHSSDDQFARYVDRARERALADLTRLAESFPGRLMESRSALQRGQPEDVIPSLSSQKASIWW